MLKLISLFFIISCPLAYADSCVDFSGDYTRREDGKALIVNQTQCEKVEFEYTSTHPLKIETFILDGVKRKTFEIDGFSNYESATFKYGWIAIEGENHFPDLVQTYQRKISMVNSRTLLDEIGRYRLDGVFIPKTQAVYEKQSRLFR